MAAIEYRGLNAVTNFDLSRYVKWLRPENQDYLNNSQPNSNGDVNPIQDHELGFVPHNQLSSTTTSGGTTVDPPGSIGGASASSALGLLLQSSKFKEMLERTSMVDCASTPPEPARRNFPDDIQTFFDCQDSSSSYTGSDDIVFGDLNSLASSIFHCELD
ncbi:AP2-like ethylene-responsive transcription factor [Quillaja saponaria]|uniref:AP2-like ethylene-responsive transcription factor n=1 Tax=Quillaja saponaria TaxID=32244 RepID=A0AAD7L5L6_QUISA|nr:AP2-like ethylene-responsive transcription factor [Quillaja saponaria]